MSAQRSGKLVILARHFDQNHLEIIPIIAAQSLKEGKVIEEGVDRGDPMGQNVRWWREQRQHDVIDCSTVLMQRQNLKNAFPNIGDFLEPNDAHAEVTIRNYNCNAALPDLSKVMYQGPSQEVFLSEELVAFAHFHSRRRHAQTDDPSPQPSIPRIWSAATRVPRDLPSRNLTRLPMASPALSETAEGRYSTLLMLMKRHSRRVFEAEPLVLANSGQHYQAHLEGLFEVGEALDRPLYWWLERRRRRRIFCATFAASQDEVNRAYASTADETEVPVVSNALITVECDVTEMGSQSVLDVGFSATIVAAEILGIPWEAPKRKEHAPTTTLDLTKASMRLVQTALVAKAKSAVEDGRQVAPMIAALERRAIQTIYPWLEYQEDKVREYGAISQYLRDNGCEGAVHVAEVLVKSDKGDDVRQALIAEVILLGGKTSETTIYPFEQRGDRIEWRPPQRELAENYLFAQFLEPLTRPAPGTPQSPEPLKEIQPPGGPTDR